MGVRCCFLKSEAGSFHLPPTGIRVLGSSPATAGRIAISHRGRRLGRHWAGELCASGGLIHCSLGRIDVHLLLSSKPTSVSLLPESLPAHYTLLSTGLASPAFFHSLLPPSTSLLPLLTLPSSPHLSPDLSSTHSPFLIFPACLPFFFLPLSPCNLSSRPLFTCPLTLATSPSAPSPFFPILPVSLNFVLCALPGCFQMPPMRTRDMDMTGEDT